MIKLDDKYFNLDHIILITPETQKSCKIRLSDGSVWIVCVGTKDVMSAIREYRSPL